jgi:hypothetical protein
MSDTKTIINIFFFLLFFSFILIPLQKEIKGQEKIEQIENPILTELNTVVESFEVNLNKYISFLLQAQSPL